MLDARSKCFFLGEGWRRTMMDLRSAALLSQPCVTIPIVTSCTFAVALTITWIVFIPPSSDRFYPTQFCAAGVLFLRSSWDRVCTLDSKRVICVREDTR